MKCNGILTSIPNETSNSRKSDCCMVLKSILNLLDDFKCVNRNFLSLNYICFWSLGLLYTNSFGINYSESSTKLFQLFLRKSHNFELFQNFTPLKKRSIFRFLKNILVFRYQIMIAI